VVRVALLAALPVVAPALPVRVARPLALRALLWAVALPAVADLVPADLAAA
jgi:hypothetical protein